MKRVDSVRYWLPRALYALIFILALPLALLAWAHRAAENLHLPVLHSIAWGATLIGCGLVIVIAGMISLWRGGGGLPMNAFPPPRFVASGIYSFLPHPIYGGFVLVCGGVSVLYGSGTGLWVVTPTAALACAALVLGYELPDLRRRFGAPDFSPWLPRDQPDAPSLLERLRIYPVILLPWITIFELIGPLCDNVDHTSTWLPFEKTLPVLGWTEPIYASTYLVVLFTPLVVPSGRALRRFAGRGLIAMALILPLYLLLPFNVPPRDFPPGIAFAPLLAWERAPFSGLAAFPSFHVVWAFIAASAWGLSGRWARVIAWCWAVLVAISCLTTGMHSIADVVAGIAAWIVIVNLPRLWNAILGGAEWSANSWHEWRIGPLRIINHGCFAAAGAFVGMLLIEALLGPRRLWVAPVIFVCTMVGALLWAQWAEGSPALLRPLGFYGGLVGALVGVIPAAFAGINLWVALAALSVAAPWIQSFGRLRCLAQGCCHGRPMFTHTGIRYNHPRSRVCRLTDPTNVSLHPTPVYSILWNLVVGAVLLRLLQLHCGSTTICGIYFLLSSLGRFVEEAWRGEPQTRVFAGLRLYQWIAMAVAVAGAAVTVVGGPPMPAIQPLHLSSMGIAILCGGLTWFITGVDFPESTRRFARLT